MCFSSSLILFPHYQALARSPRMNLSFDNLMIWVVVQNAGTAIFSLAVGPLADRRGNRLVMRLILLVIAGMPALAIGLSYAGHWGTLAYPVIFFLVGLTPIGFKILNNYTLEMSPPEHHTKYLSTLALCLAVPLVFAPPLGWLVEATDFELVFFAVSGLVGYGCLLTFTLDEPRKRGVPTALIP
jgi:MFS family permease